MDLMRLSDNSPSLLQLCVSCHLAIDSGQIPVPATTQRKNDGKRSKYRSRTWSCAVCSALASLQLQPVMHRPEMNFIELVKSLVLSSLRFNQPHEEPKYLPRSHSGPIHHNGQYSTGKTGGWISANQRTIGDIHDIIIFVQSRTRSTTIFNYPLTPVAEIVNANRMSGKPIVRGVPRTKIDVSLAKEWLFTCQNKHITCQYIKATNPRQNDNHSGLILIDVNKRRLVRGTETPRYLALSYVWGPVEQLQLTQSTWPTLQKDMALETHWKRIPQVIQDAIEFVQALGEKYLWVDALCISQDSETRHIEIGRMNEVYKQAICTLVALDSKNAACCLPGVRPNTRTMRTLAENQTVVIARRRPELAISFARSIYEQRAWTFQERLLSMRCLYFTTEQLYFHCQMELWSEDRYEHFGQDANLFGSYPSLTWPSQLLAHGSEDKWRMYVSLVKHYTRRKLSFESDRLDACSGVLNASGEQWGWTFVSGIPLEMLHDGLMWISSVGDSSRIGNLKERHRLPSWSWAGWTGGVHYLLPTTHVPGAFSLELINTDDSERVISSRRNSVSGVLNVFRKSECQTSIEREGADTDTFSITDATVSISLHKLLFTAEAVDFSKFTYSQTQNGDPGHHSGDTSPNLKRIFDESRRACGLLFYSKSIAKLQNPTLQFVLMGKSKSGPLTSVLQDTDVEMSDQNENVYDAFYRFSSGKTFNVMLIEWISITQAERVTLGQIHADAWEECNPAMQLISLG